MRYLLSLTFALAGTMAPAHPGHWGELAGHDHWGAGAAIGLAGLAAIWGALRGKKKQGAEESGEDEAGEEETA